MSTLIIGARGRIGSRVLDTLRADEEPVCASVRDPRNAPLGDVPTVVADLDRPATLASALEGTERVFLYATPRTVAGFVDAAERAGVKRVVVLSSGSVMLAANWGNPIAEDHRHVEDALMASTMSVVAIRPLVLASNALHWAHSIRSDGLVRLVHPEAVIAPIHDDDVAAVAVAALRDGDAVPVDAVLTGPESMTQRQQVARLAEGLGRELDVEQLTSQQWRDQVEGHMTAREIVGALDLLARAATSADGDRTDDVLDILGRPALSFGRWVRDHVSDFE